MELDAAGSCTIAVDFVPTLEGLRYATLGVSSAAGVSVTAALSGMAESDDPSGGIEPRSHDFGATEIDTRSSPITFKVSNNGIQPTGTPTVALDGPDVAHFEIVADGCTAPIAGGDFCEIDVEFAPTALGMMGAILEVSATPGGTLSATLSGESIM